MDAIPRISRRGFTSTTAGDRPAGGRPDRRLFVAAIFGLLSATTIAPAAEPLRAEELVREVLDRHPGTQALTQALAAAQARIAPAGALPDPMLSWALAPETFGDERLGTRQIWQLNQTIPWPGKLSLKRHAASAAAEGEEQDLAALRLQIAEQARLAFGQWHFVHQALAINKDNQALLRELEDVATQLYASGRGSQQAVLQAGLRGASLRHDALELMQRKQSIAATINALRSQPMQTAIGPPAEWPEPSPSAELTVLIDLALTHQPALQALGAREQINQHRADLAEREYFPDLRLNISHVGTLDPAEKRLQAGVSLNLPLNFSRRRQEVEAARAEVQWIHWAKQDLANQIAAAVSTAHAQRQQSLQTLALYREELLPLAEQNLVAAQADWRSGAGDFLAVVDAEQQLLTTRLGIERARMGEWTARAALARQVAAPHNNLFDEASQ